MITLVIVAVAITRSLLQKKDNPAHPKIVEKQIDPTVEAFAARDTIVHVRDEEGKPSSNPENFSFFRKEK
ncbi:MAG: hypothetical protein ACI92E_002616 [Oceanicoccus sp.]|jgi:uncharacterized protein (DUF849 family)